MSEIISLLFPVSRPTPFLGIVGACFSWSAVAALLLTIGVRFGWRRHKGLEDV